MDSKPLSPLTPLISLIILVASDVPLVKVFSALGLDPYAALGLCRLVQIAAVLGLVLGIERSWAAVGLSRSRAKKGIIKGLAWSFCFGLAAALGLALLSLWISHPLALLKTRLPEQSLSLVFFFITGGLIAPLAEEIFFRGVLFGYLRRRGFVFALIVSTVIFVAIHLPRGIPVPQIVGGLIFAISYEKEKSLWTPILIHATGNMALFSLSLI